MPNQAANENRPYLGQRCHVEGKGFGTIVVLKFDQSTGKPIAQVKLDAREIRWYSIEQLELIPVYPATQE